MPVYHVYSAASGERLRPVLDRSKESLVALIAGCLLEGESLQVLNLAQGQAFVASLTIGRPDVYSHDVVYVPEAE